MKQILIFFLAALVINIAWQFKFSLGIVDDHILNSSILTTEYPITYLLSGIAGTLPSLCICALIAYISSSPLLSAFIMSLLCLGGDYTALRETGHTVSFANTIAICRNIPDFIFFWLFSTYFMISLRKKSIQPDDTLWAIREYNKLRPLKYKETQYSLHELQALIQQDKISTTRVYACPPGGVKFNKLKYFKELTKKNI